MQNEKLDTKITRFGYIIGKKGLDKIMLAKIKSDLTVVPFVMGNFGGFNKKDKSFPVYEEDDDYISVPKYYGLEKFGKPKINRLETYEFPKYDMKYLGKLRPRQEFIVNKVIDGFDKHRGGLLLAGCGIGKTNMAIYIACKYKLKTLFIVHKDFLKRQAIDRIKSTTNLKTVGTIQRKVVNTDHAFVVAMVHSLCMIDYDDTIFRDFGLIIIDEVHHMGARNFSKVYKKMSGKYMLGISAERTRTDGMYKILNWYMGPILHIEEQKPNDMVIVKRYHYRTSNKERSELLINPYTKEPNRSKMVSNLIYIKKRNRFIIKLIEELFYQDRSILFLSGRLKQINLFYNLLESNKYIKNSVGKYIGLMSEAELKVAGTKQIILGTYSMASEGLDIENLNVVILSTPISAVKQSIGRILRKEVYEEHPIVIDIIDDDIDIFKAQGEKRNRYYGTQHYNIQNFKIADYKKDDYTMWDDTEAIKESLSKIPDKKPNNYVPKPEFKKILPVNVQDLDFSD